MKRFWSRSEVVLILVLYLLPIGIAAHGFVVARYPYLAIAYLVLNAWIYIRIRYMVCTRCVYYGERCVLFGGEAAALMFPRREGKWGKKDLQAVGVFWLIMTFAPVLALAWINLLSHLVGFVLACVLFHVIRTKIGCGKCEMRAECPAARLNPRYRTGCPGSP